MELVVGVALGIGLAAACGFRVFVPLLAISLAARAGMLSLAEGFSWIGSGPALACFAAATALEIGAYYVPWLDNALDAISTPASVAAGVVVTASCIVEMDALLKWTLAVIAGGGVAGVIKFGMVKARILSSLATGGAANPVVSTAEAGSSALLSGLALLVPLAAAGLVLVVLGWVVWRLARFFRARARSTS